MNAVQTLAQISPSDLAIATDLIRSFFHEPEAVIRTDKGGPDWLSLWSHQYSWTDACATFYLEKPKCKTVPCGSGWLHMDQWSIGD